MHTCARARAIFSSLPQMTERSIIQARLNKQTVDDIKCIARGLRETQGGNKSDLIARVSDPLLKLYKDPSRIENLLVEEMREVCDGLHWVKGGNKDVLIERISRLLRNDVMARVDVSDPTPTSTNAREQTTARETTKPTEPKKAAEPKKAPEPKKAVESKAVYHIVVGAPVKVTQSISKITSEFFANAAVKKIQECDDGVMDTVGRKMVVMEVSEKGGYAKVGPLPGSNYEYEYTHLPTSCLKSVGPPVPGYTVPEPLAPSSKSNQAGFHAHFASPTKKKPNKLDLTLRHVCMHHLAGKCKFGADKCRYIHVSPKWPLELFTQHVMDEVFKGGDYAFKNFYSKPYEKMPADFEGQSFVYYCDFNPKCGVQRPNHSLANAMRKAALVPVLCKAFKYQKALDEPELLIAMMVGMIFEVVGRESDIGFSDAKKTYQRYHHASVKAYESYVSNQLPSNKYSNRVRDALSCMYMDPKTEESEPIQEIFEKAHDLDLFRCYPEDMMTKRIEGLIQRLRSVEEAMSLVVLAETAIDRTGDRIFCSMTGLRERERYIGERFSKASKDAATCFRMITGQSAVTPAAAQAPAAAPAASGGNSRTLATSAFLRQYENTKAPSKFWKLAMHAEKVILAYAKYAKVSEELVEQFHASLLRNANDAAGDDGDDFFGADALGDVAIRMWTSTEVLKRREFCAMINHFLRQDDKDVMEDLAVLVRTLNLHCVARRVETLSWPGDSKTYRGVVLPKAQQSFYTKGKKFRAPMFVATSGKRHVAEEFVMRSASSALDDQEPTMFIFHFDPTKRCNNVNYITKTDGVVGEEEFLFAPYSTFTVRSAEWTPHPTAGGMSGQLKYHVIHLDVAIDNYDEPLDLPLSPWA